MIWAALLLAFSDQPPPSDVAAPPNGEAVGGVVSPLVQTAPQPDLLVNPVWIRRPSAQDFANYFPDRAVSGGVQGRTVTLCKVTARGTLVDCVVAVEEPAEYSFGKASLKLMPLFRMKPQAADGASVEGRTIRIPLRWNLPRGE